MKHTLVLPLWVFFLHLALKKWWNQCGCETGRAKTRVGGINITHKWNHQTTAAFISSQWHFRPMVVYVSMDVCEHVRCVHTCVCVLIGSNLLHLVHCSCLCREQMSEDGGEQVILTFFQITNSFIITSQLSFKVKSYMSFTLSDCQN